MKKFSVTALGELLVDFTQDGTLSKQGNPMFEANPGGAPCNVLAMLQKLGRSTAFIGKVGNDFFGEMLKEIIRMLKEKSEISKETADLFMKFMKNAEERKKKGRES